MGIIKFKMVSVITAVIALTLCLVLLLKPEVIFMLFSIDENSAAFFVGRRAAMLFLGISVITWVGRNASHSESRLAVCLGSCNFYAFVGFAWSYRMPSRVCWSRYYFSSYNRSYYCFTIF
jgi:hypothetical protein